MDLDSLSDLATSLAGVRRTSAAGLARWQYEGRLGARELDATHVAVQVPADVRDAMLHQHPDVFWVPTRFAKHMIVDAEDDGAVEAAVESAWRLQTQGDVGSGGDQGGW